MYFKMVLYFMKLQLVPEVPHSLALRNKNWIFRKPSICFLVKLWLLILIDGGSHLQFQRFILMF